MSRATSETAWIIVGDAMVDVTVRLAGAISYDSDSPASISQQPGGAAINTACWLARDETGVVFVGALGADEAGDAVRRQLAAFGVQAAVARVADHPTGMCVVLVDETGQRTMFPDTGANSAMDPALADPFLGPQAHVHVSGYALLNPSTRDATTALIRRARAAGATTSLDPASAGPLGRAPESVLGALDAVDLVIANEDEAAVLTGRADAQDAVAELARLTATAVVKRGALGVVAARGAEQVVRSAPAATVTDTTGAGDAFAAGFLPPWRRGRPLLESLDRGQARAALAVRRVGAAPEPA